MTEKQKADVALLVAASVMQNLASKTWMSGLGDLVEAVDEPGRYAGNWLERVVRFRGQRVSIAELTRG